MKSILCGVALLLAFGSAATFGQTASAPQFVFGVSGGLKVLDVQRTQVGEYSYSKPVCAPSLSVEFPGFSLEVSTTTSTISAVYHVHVDSPGLIVADNDNPHLIEIYALGQEGQIARHTDAYSAVATASRPSDPSIFGVALAQGMDALAGSFVNGQLLPFFQDSKSGSATLESVTHSRVITCFGRTYSYLVRYGTLIYGSVDGQAVADAVVTKTLSATRLGEPPNRPPTASFSFLPDPAFVGEEATFDASSSSDADGAIVRYRWDFGDGTVIDGDQNAVVVRHTYAAAGDWSVVLTVEDDDAGSSVAHRTVAVEPAQCTLPQGGRVVREQIAPPASGVISCGPLGVKRVVWGSFGEADFLESDRGERLQLACVGATRSVPHFILTYQSRPGVDPVTVGACPWEGGCNTVLFFHPGDNESTPSGKPDCLLSTIFLSRDYGRHNDEFTAYPENPWTEARDLTENHLDWAVSSFDVNERSLTKWDHKFDYADSIVADIVTRNVSPPLSCGVRNENGGPTSTRPVRSTLVDPPVGPETEAFFSRVLDVLQAGPGENAPMVLSGVAVCDFDSDGACGPADLNLMVTARGSCANQPDFHPAADVDADGCIGTTDQALAFADAQIVRAVADVYPGDTLDIVNLASKGVIPVALLGSTAIDVMQVDPTSAVFGRRSAVETHGRGHLEDVNADGQPDLILHFRTSDAGVRCGDSRAVLTAATFSGALVEAVGSIITSGCVP